jgi:hypothetical protein
MRMQNHREFEIRDRRVSGWAGRYPVIGSYVIMLVLTALLPAGCVCANAAGNDPRAIGG